MKSEASALTILFCIRDNDRNMPVATPPPPCILYEENIQTRQASRPSSLRVSRQLPVPVSCSNSNISPAMSEKPTKSKVKKVAAAAGGSEDGTDKVHKLSLKGSSKMVAEFVRLFYSLK